MKPLAYCKDLGDRLIVVNANTAKRNALTPEFYGVLAEALELASNTARITSVILRSESGFFCAGGNLGALATRRDLTRDQRQEKIDQLHDLIRAIIACPKPVIAAVEGGAAGAGVSIVLACDLIVAAEDAKFTIAYVKAGLTPDGGLTKTLAAHLPRATLMRLALLGEPIPAQRLYALGAISEIAKPGHVIAAATDLAEALALGPSATHGTIKALLNTAPGNSLATQLDAERDAMADAVMKAEAEEGIRAFLDKRPPDFKTLRSRS